LQNAELKQQWRLARS